MKWNGRYYRPGYGIPVYPKKEQSIIELLKPLGEKEDKGNVWRPILNQPINVFKAGVVPIAFDPDYQAILNYATTQGYTLPSSSGQTLQNQLVVQLKSAGIWTDLDILYIMATDGDENYAKLNWKNPGNFTLIENGTVNFTTNVGFKPNTANVANYLNTQFNFTLHPTGYTQNDALRFVWDSVPIAGAYVYDGQFDGPRDTFNGQNSIDQRICNQVSLPTAFNNVGSGLKVIERTSATNVNLYNNTSSPTSFVSNSSAFFSTNQVLFRRGAGGFSLNTLGMYGLGASLTTKVSDLLSATTTYMTSL